MLIYLVRFRFNVERGLMSPSQSKYIMNFMHNSITVHIIQSIEERFITTNLTHYEAYVTSETNMKNLLREIKRIIITFIPFDQTPSELAYFYFNRLLIFDFYLLDMRTEWSNVTLVDILHSYENHILAYIDAMGLSSQNVRINY